MSTRCNIAFYENEEKSFEEFEALIYKHSDGYPDGVLPLLIPFVQRFLLARGYDVEYLSARTLQYFANETDRSLQEYRGGRSEGFEVLGFGICKDFHGDIEYLYCVYPEKVKVYSVPFDWAHSKEGHELEEEIETR